MSPLVGFLVFLGLTLCGLGGVFWTGMHARRRQHIPLVVITICMLGAAIFYAEQMGKGLDLEAAGRIYPVHMFLAKSTTLAYLAPVVTGIMTLRAERWRRVHRPIAWTVLTLTLLTAVTGTWMALAAPAI
jgi:hypothetical protein